MLYFSNVMSKNEQKVNIESLIKKVRDERWEKKRKRRKKKRPPLKPF